MMRKIRLSGSTVNKCGSLKEFLQIVKTRISLEKERKCILQKSEKKHEVEKYLFNHSTTIINYF